MKPFLQALDKTPQETLRERMIDHVFNPLLESNVTAKDSDDSSSEEKEESEEENLALVDGGKLSKRTR